MECSISPGCIPVSCVGSACKSLPNIFQIIKIGNERVSIRDGDTVVLRSVDHFSHFLDCSDSTRCTLSTCRIDSYVWDLNSYNYISTCGHHQFEIFGIKRKNKILSTRTRIYFRKKFANEFYLSCNWKMCYLQVKGDCPINQKYVIFNPPRDSLGRCPIDTFRVTKIDV